MYWKFNFVEHVILLINRPVFARKAYALLFYYCSLVAGINDIYTLDFLLEFHYTQRFCSCNLSSVLVKKLISVDGRR